MYTHLLSGTTGIIIFHLYEDAAVEAVEGLGALIRVPSVANRHTNVLEDCGALFQRKRSTVALRHVVST
jgi:hypothetical protein